MKKPPFGRRRGSTTEPQNQEYWLSYSDLLAGLLMVFVLMLLVATTTYTKSRTEYERTQAQLMSIVKSMTVREQLIRELRGIDNDDIIVDTVTAGVGMRDAVLFGEGSAVLQPGGQRVLERFAQDYLPIVMESELYRSHLREIAIEGHTNDNGPYLYNMQLSQDRAYAVMLHLFSVTADPDTREFLERFLTARGRSESEVICVDGRTAYSADCGLDGVDKEGSRRIEIRFRLDDEEVVRQVMQTMLDER